MIGFYIVCLLCAVALFLWQNISDERRSITQHIMLLVVVIANCGYLSMAVSTSLSEAVLATKIMYIGGCFLPMLYFVTVCEMCHIHIEQSLLTILYLLQMFVYAGVCTIGWNTWYYRNVEFHLEQGTAYLIKDYGALHAFYPFSMYVYFALALGVAIYALCRKSSVNKRSILLMLVSFGLAIACYLVERITGMKFKVMPAAYILLMTGSAIQSYESNLFTVEENQNIIREQLEHVGFITFDRHMHYMGCNGCAAGIFPELRSYAVGSRIREPELEFRKNILEMVAQFSREHPQHHEKEHHAHAHMNTFTMQGRTYDCMIHTLQNYYGKTAGYTIELQDETEHYKALALFEDYNKTLASEVAQKTQKIRNMQENIILGMAQMVESRDLSTGGHIKRTSGVVRIFAEELLQADLGLEKDFLKLVIRSAPMHDLGKIGVDDAVLRKQGRFTDEEYAKMKKHAANGAKIVREVLTGVEEEQFVQVATNVAHYHHEKVDGTGYPDGLAGNAIPIEARIMALADVFDALVSKRCYKEAFSFDKAFTIIKEDVGTHFDAALAEVFLQCRSKLELYYESQVE